jgi:hypothetical protein
MQITYDQIHRFIEISARWCGTAVSDHISIVSENQCSNCTVTTLIICSDVISHWLQDKFEKKNVFTSFLWSYDL